MTSDNDKKAAEEYLKKHTFIEVPSIEANKIKIDFLAGCEHKQKELEQIKEQVAREAYKQGQSDIYPDSPTFNDYWQQKNKGEG